MEVCIKMRSAKSEDIIRLVIIWVIRPEIFHGSSLADTLEINLIHFVEFLCGHVCMLHVGDVVHAEVEDDLVPDVELHVLEHPVGVAGRGQGSECGD